MIQAPLSEGGVGIRIELTNTEVKALLDFLSGGRARASRDVYIELCAVLSSHLTWLEEVDKEKS